MADISSAGQEDIASVPLVGDLWKYPLVEEPLEIRRDRLERLVAESSYTARSLSLALGKNHAYIGQLIKGKGGMPSGAVLTLIAQSLNTTVDYLLGRVDVPAQAESEVSISPAPKYRRNPDVDGIPLLGTGYCDDLIFDVVGDGEAEIERLQLDIDHVVRYIERPAALLGVKDAYAIYFHGSSMEPRYFQGETGIVDPRRPPAPGDFVVVQLNNGESSHVITVLVKRFVRFSGATAEFEQFNPRITFRVPRSRISRMHRICSPNEVYGT